MAGRSWVAGRATIIEETTCGARRPVELFELAEGFSANIPSSTIEHLVTGEGFEPQGARPDIALTDGDDSAH